MEPVLHEDRPISSSRVREALGRGAVEQAEALLGHPFFVDGVVVEGERRGRTLGFPTANLQTENEALPSSGVYAVRCRVSTGQWVPGVANLGHRPTFGGTGPSVEAHLIGFDADLYGSRLRLQFEARVRASRSFRVPRRSWSKFARTWSTHGGSWRILERRAYSRGDRGGVRKKAQ